MKRFVVRFNGMGENNMWESSLEMSFKSFVRWFVEGSGEFCYTKFRDNVGFTRYQMNAIKINLDKFVYFEESQAKIVYFQQDLYESNVVKQS